MFGLVGPVSVYCDIEQVPEWPDGKASVPRMAGTGSVLGLVGPVSVYCDLAR